MPCRPARQSSSPSAARGFACSSEPESAPGSCRTSTASCASTSTGQEIEGSPFRSLNGPIGAPANPSWGQLDHSLNFPLLVPAAGSVTIEIEIDPWDLVPESDTSNNTAVVADLEFLCRAPADLAYVPIDYLPGAGLPDPGLMRPGRGDAMVQAIFGSGGTLYHPAPLPPLVWNSNIDVTSAALLGALQDIRLNLIPAAGFPRPDFVYGWLPGNPYWANGQASGIPGDAGFGNTMPNRFQRTFAHELGHLVGRVHVTNVTQQAGVDVEHHLLLTEGLPQLVPTGKFDVMVPGKLTHEAWVNNASFHAFVDDPRMACTPGGAGGDGPPAGDAPDGIRIGGVLDHEAGLLALRPLMPVWAVAPTPDDPAGDLRIELLAGDAVVHSVRIETQSARVACVAPGVGRRQFAAPRHGTTWVSAIVPAALLDRDEVGLQVDTVRAVRISDGAVLGERWRSATRPTVALGEVRAVVGDIDPAGREGGAVRDLGGDLGGGRGQAEELPTEVVALEIDSIVDRADAATAVIGVLYSPDGVRWLPAVHEATGATLRLPLHGLPAARDGRGRVRVVVSDGFDFDLAEGGIAGATGPGVPPEVHLVTPNHASLHLQHAAIFLHAAAWDLDDGVLPDGSIVWESDRDGVIAVGRLLAFAGLSPGEHLLTVWAADSDGMVGSDSVSVTIVPRPFAPGNPDLNGDGLVNGLDLGLLLNAWGPCPGCQADLNGDGIVDGADLGVLLSAWTG